MNKLFEASLKRLKGEGVAFELPEDWNDLARLHEAAETCVAHTGSKRYRAALKPVLYLENGVVLRRPSIGVAEWMADELPRLCAKDARIADLSILYCMSVADDPAELWKHDARSQREWHKTVKTWARSIRIDAADAADLLREWEAVGREVDALVEESHKEESGDADPGYGWVIETLVKEYGQTVDYWLWTASIDAIAMLLDERRSRLRSEARQQASKGLYALASDPDDASTRALWKFRQIESEIRAKKI